MAGIIDYGCTGTLTISGVSMNTPAWDCVDLTELWLGGDVRGSDRLLPGVPGVKAYKRRTTVTGYSLPMVLTGEVDRFGTVNGDWWAGLEANIDYLRANVVDPTNLTDGTRAAVLTMPSGATRTADIHVLGLEKGTVLAGVMLATLDISIPDGVFA